MPVDIRRYRTSQFTERAPLIALGALGLLAVAAIAAPFFSHKLLEQSITVPPGQTVQLDPIQPHQRPFGAVRIDTLTNVPNNAWVTFEVQVLDSQGNPLASGIKQAWQESGTWQEEGETGTWSERDLEGRFDIRRAAITEPITIAITLVEQGTTSGQPLNQPVAFRVTVWDGAIDDRFLWSGLVGVLILAGLTALAVYTSGQTVIAESVNDSDLGGRGTLGGPGNLVRVLISVVSDETSPATLNAELAIKDGQGAVIYRRRLPIRLSLRRENGKIDSARGQCTLDLILEPAGSYGFYVEIVPDAPVDWTYLKVKQNIRTLQPTEVAHLKSP